MTAAQPLQDNAGPSRLPTWASRDDASAAMGLALFVGALFVLSAAWHRFAVPAAVVLAGVSAGLCFGAVAVLVSAVQRRIGILALSPLGFGFVGVVAVGRFSPHGGASYWVTVLAAAAVAGVLHLAVGRAAERAGSAWQAGAILLSLALAAGPVGNLVLDPRHVNFVFPEAVGFPQWHVGALLLTPARTAMLIILAPLMLALASPLVDRLRMPWLWALLGAVTVLVSVLVWPTQGLLSAEGTVVPGVVAVLAAALAGFRPFGTAAVAVAIGVLQQVMLWNWPSGLGLRWLGPVVLLMLGVRALRERRTLTAPPVAQSPFPMGGLVVVLCLAFASVVASQSLTRSHTVILCGGASLVMFALPHVLVRDRGVNLAFPTAAYFAAAAAWRVSEATTDVILLLVTAVAVAVVATLVLGLVTTGAEWLTTAGSLALASLLFDVPASFGSGQPRPSLTILGAHLDGPHATFKLCAALVVAASVIVWGGVARGPWARTALSGAVAGLGAIGYAASLSLISPVSFPVQVAFASVVGAAVVAAAGAWLVVLAVSLLLALPGYWWATHGDSTWQRAAIFLVMLAGSCAAPYALGLASEAREAPSEADEDGESGDDENDSLPPAFDDVISN